MKARILTAMVALCLVFGGNVRADEGMWLPFLIGQKKYAEMQRLGLKLTKEQLYDINNASLKDAIVQLDGGNCTGEMISAEGLLLTNHHCGYGEIQAHSSVEHDYLTNGFWAMSRDEELANPGKTASFLIRIEDVTEKILKDVTDDMSEAERRVAIKQASSVVEKEAIGETHYEAHVRSMFAGNEYYMFVYETFLDVRLVGAPPSSIGKYGGDTDNWIWPRHTGDFCMFRVYMGPDGKPAKYAKDNVPYQPKHSLPVSLKGVEQDDYAMIMGYPGSTDRYLTSFGIELTIDQLNPTTVMLRDKKMKIMKAQMDKSDKVRIQYASKYAYLGNFWKKDAEQIKALKRLRVADQKREVENQFNDWANADSKRKEKYGNVIPAFEEYYKLKTESQSEKAFWYLVETAFNQGAEIFTFSQNAGMLMGALKKEMDPTVAIDELRKAATAHFKDYNQAIDKGVMVAMFEAFYNDLPENFHPSIFKEIEKKYKGSFQKYADNMYKKSVFASEENLEKFLKKPKYKTLENDPAIVGFGSLYQAFMDMRSKEGDVNEQFGQTKRLFIAGLREMNADKEYYPDANSTMRLTYGVVKDYVPRDAVEYDYITYLDGVMEKEDPTNEEFIVMPKLKELYQKKDYGQYGMGDKMPVCFVANLDITGGNSGSPVINGNGELIGTAFDGNSEAMSSDIQFDHDLQRTIVCDIRYVLFVVDKYAGAKHLIDEMKIVK